LILSLPPLLSFSNANSHSFSFSIGSCIRCVSDRRHSPVLRYPVPFDVPKSSVAVNKK
jgi:hypothetical protein